MIRREEEVDEMIRDMKDRTKGTYITQGVSFNKSCPRQMELLKNALIHSASFSGLVKEMLAVNLESKAVKTEIPSHQHTNKPKSKNIGNFI